MGELRGPAAGDQGDRTMVPVVLWGVVVALAATAVGALVLALGLLLFDRLRPTPSVFLAVSLTAVAVGALWASRRMGRGGLWVGAATGLGYGLLAWVLGGIFGLGPASWLGILQAFVSAVVVGAVAGIIGVNL